MQPYRRTDTRGPAPVRVRGPGSAAPDRVRAWAFAPGCGPCRASTRTTRRAAGKRTPAAARARPSADGWAGSGSWERRGLGPDSCGRGVDAAGSSWAAPGAGQPRRWWRRPRDPPPGPRRPDVYQGHEADHATRGRPPGDAGKLVQATASSPTRPAPGAAWADSGAAGNLAQATGQIRPDPAPHARACVASTRRHRTDGGPVRAGPGQSQGQAKTRPDRGRGHPMPCP